MNRSRSVETARYQTESASGRKVTVVEMTKQIQFKTYDSGDHRLSGTKSFSTSDGKPVNWLSDTSFELVTTGEILTRV